MIGDTELLSGYTPREMVRAIYEAIDYLQLEHRPYGCIGCDRCTRTAMLDNAASGILELAGLEHDEEFQ